VWQRKETKVCGKEKKRKREQAKEREMEARG